MVIKLQNADFSANNIGNIDITTVSEFTLDAISASGNSSMTSEQKSALETFFRTVGAKDNSGVWTKLTKVYIPFLSADLAHAMINYKGNANDVTLSSSVFEMRHRGVASILTENAAANAPVPMIIDSADMSYFFMYAENYPTAQDGNGKAKLFAYNGSSGTNRFFCYSGLSGAGYYQVQRGFVSPSGINTVVFEQGSRSSVNVEKKLLGISASGASCTGLFFDGHFETKTQTGADGAGTDTENRNALMFAEANGNAPLATDASVSVLLIGKALTQAEMTTLKDAFDLLASKF